MNFSRKSTREDTYLAFSGHVCQVNNWMESSIWVGTDEPIFVAFVGWQQIDKNTSQVHFVPKYTKGYRNFNLNIEIEIDLEN